MILKNKYCKNISVINTQEHLKLTYLSKKYCTHLRKERQPKAQLLEGEFLIDPQVCHLPHQGETGLVASFGH